MKLKLLFIFLLSISSIFLLFAKENLKCTECNRNIRGRYVQNNRGTFCSKRCLAKHAPRCRKCGKICLKNEITFLTRSYCSQKCYDSDNICRACHKPVRAGAVIRSRFGIHTLFCNDCIKKNKRCSSCALPNPTRPLKDGRTICKYCYRTAVTSEKQIVSYVAKVRKDLNRLFNFDTKHKITVELATQYELDELMKNVLSPGSAVAVMMYSCKGVRVRRKNGKKVYERIGEKYVIKVLTYIPLDYFLDALAHELAHDFLRHSVGFIEDLQLEEGFCEAIAAEYNRRRKKPRLNIAKQENKDKIYGDGFRKMYPILRKKGFNYLLGIMKEAATPMPTKH